MQSPRSRNRSPFARSPRGARLTREMNVEMALRGECAGVGKYTRAGHSVAQGTINFLGQNRSRKAYTVRPHCAKFPTQTEKVKARHDLIRQVVGDATVARQFGKSKLSAAEAQSYLKQSGY